jgi:hypothetical protein
MIKNKNIDRKSSLHKYFMELFPRGGSADLINISGAYTSYAIVPFASLLERAVVAPTADVTGSNGTTISVKNLYTGSASISATIIPSSVYAGQDWSAGLSREILASSDFFYSAGTLVGVTISATNGTPRIPILLQFDKLDHLVK